MQPRHAIAALLVPAALMIAASAAAQSTDKESSAAPKQSSRSPSATKPAATSKRLDFVPSGTVKETAATRGTAPPAANPPSQAPAKSGSHCHMQESDA